MIPAAMLANLAPGLMRRRVPSPWEEDADPLVVPDPVAPAMPTTTMQVPEPRAVATPGAVLDMPDPAIAGPGEDRPRRLAPRIPGPREEAEATVPQLERRTWLGRRDPDTGEETTSRLADFGKGLLFGALRSGGNPLAALGWGLGGLTGDARRQGRQESVDEEQARIEHGHKFGAEQQEREAKARLLGLQGDTEIHQGNYWSARPGWEQQEADARVGSLGAQAYRDTMHGNEYADNPRYKREELAVESGDRRYGTDTQRDTARRGQDMSSQDRRYGIDTRSQDSRYSTDTRSEDSQYRTDSTAAGKLGGIPPPGSDPLEYHRALIQEAAEVPGLVVDTEQGRLVPKWDSSYWDTQLAEIEQRLVTGDIQGTEKSALAALKGQRKRAEDAWKDAQKRARAKVAPQRSAGRARTVTREDARAILDRAYAAGQLSEKEYRRRLAVLGQ